MRWLSCFLLIILCSACTTIDPRTAQQLTQSRQLIERGTAHLRLGQLTQAEAAFKLSYELHPSPNALDGLGCVEFRRKNFQKAEQFFIDSYELDHNYLNSMANLALIYDLAGKKEPTRELFELALRKNPENYKIRNNFGVHLYDKHSTSLKSKDEAISELQKAAAVNSSEVILKNISEIADYE